MQTTNIITIDLPKKTDAFIAGNKLKNIPGIKGVSMVTLQQLRVKYDIRKTTADSIAAIVNGTIDKH